MIELAVLLIIAHVLGDFYFQRKEWVTDKEQNGFRSFALYKHTAVHLVFSGLVIFYWGAAFGQTIIAALFIGLTHCIIDIVKSKRQNTTRIFVADQLAHLVALLIAWMYLTGSNLTSLFSSINQQIDVIDFYIVAGYLIALKPTSILMSMMLSKFIDRLPNDKNNGLEAAGHTIGYLERFLIITFVLINQYSGVGFLLAAKSILRVGDLTKQHDKNLTEYVLLGTLLSTTIALVVAILVKQVANI